MLAVIDPISVMQKPVTPASAKPVPVFDVFLRRQTNKGAEVRPPPIMATPEMPHLPMRS